MDRTARRQVKAGADHLLAQLATNAALTADQVQRVRASVVVRDHGTGHHVCQRGACVDGWLGVVAGCVKIENVSATGQVVTVTTFSPGCWFGEGSVLKEGVWPFDAVALTDSQVVLVPRAVFEWLLGTSFTFNRFLLDQLNARLAQFVERCVYERLHDAEAHVVHGLVEMIDPRFYPHCQASVAMSQESLGRMTGVSRSVVNRVLRRLQAAGIVRIDYRAIQVLDAEALRRFTAN